jgi:predicted RNase H-like nuclease (RuvC/YqgF family)
LRKSLIVGLDPGTTTGIAILDIDGNLLYSTSKRNLKRSETIKIISSLGRPIIFATDVSPPPRAVERLVSAFGCTIFYPEKPLSVLEKQELVKVFGEKLLGHEADALAACLKAWKNYRKFFEKIKRLLADRQCLHLFDEVAIKLLKEGSENVDAAVEEILSQKPKEEKELPVKDKSLEKIEKVLREKDREIGELKHRLENLAHALERKRIESRISERLQFSFARIEDYEKELEELKRANNLLKAFERIKKKNLEPLIELETISGLQLEKLDRLIGLEGRVVYCNSTENLTALNPFGIRAFLTESDKELDLGKLEFPVLRIKPDVLKHAEGIKAVSEEFLENGLKEVRKEGLIKWLEDYRKRKRNY